jgi:SAM-dependent methyltransferase
MSLPPITSADAPTRDTVHVVETDVLPGRGSASPHSPSPAQLTDKHAESEFSLYQRAVTRIAAPDAINIECPLCAALAGTPTFAVEGLDSRVVVCRECRFGHLYPLPSPAQILTFYPPAYYGSTGRKFNRLVEFAVRLVAARHVRFLARRVPRGGRILDVGCGRGVLLKELADRGFEAHGFEVSAAAAEGVDSRIAIRIGNDLRDANYPADYFDQVIIWHVLEHVADPRATIEEIHRILKPGGEIVVAVPNFSSLQARWSGPAWFHLDLPRHLYHFPSAGLAKLLEECGFRVESSHHFSLRQNPFGWVQSALNKLPGLRRNSLYELLHRRNGDRVPFGLMTRLALYAAFVAGMPIALLIEIAASLLRTGATVHFVAWAETSPKSSSTAPAIDG